LSVDRDTAAENIARLIRSIVAHNKATIAAATAALVASLMGVLLLVEAWLKNPSEERTHYLKTPYAFSNLPQWQKDQYLKQGCTIPSAPTGYLYLLITSNSKQ
jgi:hypothetical protein